MGPTTVKEGQLAPAGTNTTICFPGASPGCVPQKCPPPPQPCAKQAGVGNAITHILSTLERFTGPWGDTLSLPDSPSSYYRPAAQGEQALTGKDPAQGDNQDSQVLGNGDLGG